MLLETEILNKYKSGELQGIYVTDLCFYMPIRITGTGLTIRKEEDKFYICNREKSLFLSEEIVKACSNIPIIINHPDSGGDKEKETNLLSFKTIGKNPIIGQTIYAYINDEEIWAIGRIYDFKLLDRLNNDIHSTSPAVFSGEVEEENGTSKEIPFIINHIAFVERGHWDQKSEVAYDDSKITIQGMEKMENIKKDSSEEEKIEKIESAEKKEAEHYKEMAEEHKSALNSNKGDSMEEEKVKSDETIEKDEEIKKDEEMENSQETKKDEEKEIKSDEGEEVEIVGEIPDEEIESKIDEILEEKLKNDDEVEEEAEVDDDKERDSIIDTMTEIADSVDPEVGFKKVVVFKREKPSSLLGRILKVNKHLVDSKYSYILEDVNDLNYGLAVDAFNNLIINAQKEDEKILKNEMKSSRHKWVKLADGISVNRGF